MLKNCYEELKEKKNLRENLSLLRGEVKDSEKKEKLKELAGDGSMLRGLLFEEDPKVRKNAALLLGDLELESAKEDLFTAYNKETTLFVKSAYLTALKKMQIKEYLPVFRERLALLTGEEPAENEKKHILSEVRELEEMIAGISGIKCHTFSGFQKDYIMLLTANREFSEVVLKEVKNLPAEIQRKVKPHPLGVLAVSKEIVPFLHLRTYREMLFPIRTRSKISQSPKEAAEILWQSGLDTFLKECHKETDPFYFRLEIRSRMELDKKSSFAKKLAAELERLSGRFFINSTKDYEVEIRLIEIADGTMAPFLKLFTLPVKRFAYRKHAISASIHPAMAAVLVELAKPYLIEDAQILDPFCGVGTMLIERDIRVPAREKYGIDIFGDAIGLARENAVLAGERINFIHRDYFDFRHDYKFDEIITNMPVRGKRTKEEQDAFYGRFFEKTKEILASSGIIILYTNESGFVKKHLRLNPEYKLLQEFSIREKDHFYLFIIGTRGNADGIFN